MACGHLRTGWPGCFRTLLFSREEVLSTGSEVPKREKDFSWKSLRFVAVRLGNPCLFILHLLGVDMNTYSLFGVNQGLYSFGEGDQKIQEGQSSLVEG